MTTSSSAERLATLVGIPASYVDAFGHTVDLSLKRRAGIAAHLGFPSGTEAETADSLRRIEAVRLAPVPKLVVAQAGKPTEIAARGGSAAGTWRLLDESGAVREGGGLTRRGDGAVLRLPALPLGYYTLELAGEGPAARATVIAAPARCWEPRWMKDGERLWGLAAQIYAFRSDGDLGIGSYDHIRDAAAGAAPLGASFLGLSPVHALFEADREKISPYSPSSRLMLETIHIAPALIPGFAGGAAERLLAEPDRQGRIAALRELSLIDHQGVWAELGPVLEAAWAEGLGRDDPAFAAFRREMGGSLESHALFETLSEHFRREGRWWLGDWPDAFRERGSSAVADFAAAHADRVSFHAWLQYLADAQLARAAAAAREGGMAVGLYRDLAVGSDRGGSEIWAHPERFGNTLSVGAPPDLLAPQGQDWGLPPLHPIAMEEDGLLAFRDLVRANMRHAGAIRIDHAFQLQRLYLIPVGRKGDAGAYVSYPFDAMLAVLRLESHRARALVIAEDLGTGPEGFSDAIMRSGLLSYRVLSFERTGDGGFKPPEDYPRDALSVITTHDLPTFAGWWRGLDTELRQTMGIYDAAQAERERHDRVDEKVRLLEAFAAAGLANSAEVQAAPPAEAVTRFLARTPSALNAIQYEDVLGSLNQPNMPGTNEGPNWRRRLDLDLGAIHAPGGPLAKVAASVSAEGRGPRASQSPLSSPAPRATYRFQFHEGFTFDDAIPVVPYLVELGISHVYASPIAKARPGSTHGYDIVDHAAINPELGGEEAFGRLSDALREAGLGLILDIVPNHMGVGGADNTWWLSMLEWGHLSPASSAFDIDWERLGAHGKLVLPVLGDRYGVALEKGDLKLTFDEADGSFSVWHFEHRLPITPLSYPLILDRAFAALDTLEGQGEVLAISDGLRAMADEASPERRAAFPAEAEAMKRRLAAAVAASPDLARATARAVAVVNGVPGMADSFGTLHRILDMQSYRPAHWRVASSEINYRRFFDINTLAGIRVELPHVFEETHALVFRLVREGRVQGLRIDHIDGLADPEGYAKALQAAVGPGFYVVIEKILEPGEPLRPWPVAGTTGYDVLNTIDGVLVNTDAAERIRAIYRATSGIDTPYGTQLLQAKSEVLQSSFASELEVLTSDLKRIADGDRRTRDFPVNGLRIALAEIVARFPVYRSYVTEAPPDPADVTLVSETVDAAKRASLLPDTSVHDFVADALLGRIETTGSGRPAPDHVSRFRRRFQQLTGPVMAKSLEDTLFYRYVPLLSLNEVGGDPGHFGLSVEGFHASNAERMRLWPHAMVASATHDTKRGEDARARIAAIAEDPDRWEAALADWTAIVEPLRGEANGAPAPDANDGYLLLQSLLGAWPFALLERDDPAELEAFRQRFDGFVDKALREAKRHSSWINPNAAYEGAAHALVAALLTPGSAFLERFRPYARWLARAGLGNSLARTALKYTVPGVPDTYQGTAGWDLSLVDPDNRRPVDYPAAARSVGEEAPVAELLAGWTDGRIKQRLVRALLADRAAAPDLYADGDYHPLVATGTRAAHVLAFTRVAGREALVVAVARLAAGLAGDETAALGPVWEGTSLPVEPGRWRDVVTGREHEIGRGGADARELFGSLPVAVLRRIG